MNRKFVLLALLATVLTTAWADTALDGGRGL